MYGKKHNLWYLKAISNPGSLNPMFTQPKNIEVKQRKKISDALRKIPIGLYDKNNNLLKTFQNQV